MKLKTLLSCLSLLALTAGQAQKKAERPVAYAITGAEKGSHRWMEVSLVDLTTGEVLSPTYRSGAEVQRLNARTGKPILIREPESLAGAQRAGSEITRYVRTDNGQPAIITVQGQAAVKEVVPVESPAGVDTRVRTEVNNKVRTIITNVNTNVQTGVRQVIITRGAPMVAREQPFATTSAACAFDKKHERLYYTPMGINQLRYIDLKSGQVYYFEDEAFGTVTGTGDVDNQITRMTMASDGNGYALTNDGSQLIQFSTKKKATIANLGAITDDPANGRFTIRSRANYGGDMVADDKENLYLVTASRRVYRISLESRVATYLGSIQGLPEGFSTNGAAVEGNSSIIVTSSSSTDGYYRFSLDNMQAEKITSGRVFNASDLANDKLLSIKKKKEDKETVAEQQPELAQQRGGDNTQAESPAAEAMNKRVMAVYPNPISTGSTRISLANYAEGRYELQLVDLNGRLLNRQVLQVSGKSQVVDYKLPEAAAKGTYFLQVRGADGSIAGMEKLVVL